MKKIIGVLTSPSARFALVSAFIAAIFVFVVMPVLPDTVSPESESLSLRALVTFAEDGGGAGDPGGGCCGDGPSGPGDPGGPSDPVPSVTPTPTCSLTITPESITRGESATLSWTTTDAATVSIDNGIGNVSLAGSRNETPQNGKTYTLTATGAGGTVTCSDTIVVVIPPAPYCALEITKTANRTTANVDELIIYTLSFRNTGTGKCTGGGVKVLDVLPSEVSYVSQTQSSNVTPGYGSFEAYHVPSHTVYWNADTLTPGESGTVSVTVRVKPRTSCGTYSFSNQGKITAYELNNFGTWVVSNAVLVSVENACPNPAPVCTLEMSPSTITRGGSATLTWTTQNASSVSIDSSIGGVSATGTRSVSPVANTTYTLTATGNGTTVTCVKTVTVNEPEPDPVVSCDAFTANPSILTSAGTTTLTWATTNATSVSIDTGVGAVAVDGSQAVFVDKNTTFTLTATRGSQSKTCIVPVTIVPNVVIPKCDAFTVSPNSVREGSSVTLSWNTTDATAVSINSGVGTVDLDGSKTVTPGSDTTYVLTATNGSAQTSCQVSVNVDEDNGGGGGGGGGSSSPRCTLKASDESIKAGEKVTLTWKNLRTNDILLKDNRGATLIDTTKSGDDKKYDEDEGRYVVEPTKSTSYTLSAIKGSKKKTCTVDIKVEGVVVTSTRSNEPLVAGISLSRMPYTGFDAGPLLTTLFYALLGLWALYVAYALVLKKSVVVGAGKIGTILHDMPIAKKLEHQVVVPTMKREAFTAAEVSRMGYVPSLMTAPRMTPVHSMTSPYAPVGYEAYYESYGSASEVRANVVPEIENLPVGPLPESVVAPVAEASPINVEALESHAHEAHVLMSTDALNFIAGQSTNDTEATELLDTVIGAAKASFPKEDGWVVVNKEKILSLLK